MTGAAGAGAAVLAWSAYRRDLKAATLRIETERQFIDSDSGPIEFAESGNGPAVLLIHGAGGGFDQGIDLGRSYLGSNYRIIAPSRFGYLGTPLPEDASPEAQADAYLRLLDTLQLDRVPVIAVSAGAPSAMQFCLRHPERCSALGLIVPLAYAPARTVAPPSRLFEMVLNAIAAFDFIFWTATKIAHSTLLETILGTPVEIYRSATAEERREVDRILRSILPMSRRTAGIANDGVVSTHLTRYRLEDISVPTLVIGAADCLYRTYEGSLYTAEQIRHAKLVAFPNGGHLLVGHDAEVRLEIASLLNESLAAKKKTA